MEIILDYKQASAVVVANAFCELHKGILFTKMELAEVKPSYIDIYPVILLEGSREPVLDKRVIVISLEGRWLYDRILGHYRFDQTKEGIRFTELVEKEKPK